MRPIVSVIEFSCHCFIFFSHYVGSPLTELVCYFALLVYFIKPQLLRYSVDTDMSGFPQIQTNADRLISCLSRGSKMLTGQISGTRCWTELLLSLFAVFTSCLGLFCCIIASFPIIHQAGVLVSCSSVPTRRIPTARERDLFPLPITGRFVCPRWCVEASLWPDENMPGLMQAIWDWGKTFSCTIIFNSSVEGCFIISGSGGKHHCVTLNKWGCKGALGSCWLTCVSVIFGL